MKTLFVWTKVTLIVLPAVLVIGLIILLSVFSYVLIALAMYLAGAPFPRLPTFYSDPDDAALN